VGVSEIRTVRQESLPPLCDCRYVNGVPLGPGLCVVDEDGFIIPIAKCTVKELRAEAEARQIVGAKDMKRPDLTSAIKVGGTVCNILSIPPVYHARLGPSKYPSQRGSVETSRDIKHSVQYLVGMIA